MSLPETEKSTVFAGAASTPKEKAKDDKKPTNISEVKKDTPKSAGAKTNTKEVPVENETEPVEIPEKKTETVDDTKKPAPKKRVAPKLDTTDANFLFSLKTSFIKAHPGIITIATLMKPVNTKKRQGFEFRYGAAFCSPDDVFDKKVGKDLALKRLANDRMARTVFVTKKKLYRIAQAIYADILASGNFPHWGRDVVFNALKESMIKEETVKYEARQLAASQRIMQESKKVDRYIKGNPGLNPFMHLLPNSNSLINVIQNGFGPVVQPKIDGTTRGPVFGSDKLIGIAKEPIDQGQILQIGNEGYVEPAKPQP